MSWFDLVILVGVNTPVDLLWFVPHITYQTGVVCYTGTLCCYDTCSLYYMHELLGLVTLIPNKALY